MTKAISKEFNSQYTSIKKMYVLMHILADFGAAILFLVGSVLFLYPSWIYSGTWLFIIGSFLFATKPTIKLLHFLHLKKLIKKAKLKIEDLPNLDILHW